MQEAIIGMRKYDHMCCRLLACVFAVSLAAIARSIIVVEIGSSRAVTWRVHPPLETRFRASPNEYLKGGTVPLSVSGDQFESGFCPSSAAFFGPGALSFGRWWSGE